LLSEQIKLLKEKEDALRISITSKKEEISKEKHELLVITKARIQLEKLMEQFDNATKNPPENLEDE